MIVDGTTGEDRVVVEDQTAVVGTGVIIGTEVADKDKSILLLFHLFFFLAILFLTYYALSFNILLKLSYIASYLTVTSYTLYTSTAYTHHGQL